MRRIIRPVLPFFYETTCVIGSSGNLKIGEKVATANTLFNLSSGSIALGNYSIFGQNVMLLTGRHNFLDGKRAGWDVVRNTSSWGGGNEVPDSGYDIEIGEGCWIASGSLILGGVTIGDHSIVCAAAVVTKSFPEHSIIAGVPAKRIGDTRSLGTDS